MRRSHALNRVESKKSENKDMDPIKLQVRSTSLFSKSKHAAAAAKSSVVVSTIIAFLVTLIALLSCYCLFVSKASIVSGKKYGIVVDGGSTGTRIHVFGYRIAGGRVAFDFREGAALRVNPGLSAYAEDPEAAGGSLEQLVEFGKGRVPRELWGETEIRLMATAGMRLLQVEVQERILEACRRVLRKSGFKFKDDWASVISGSDEGVYAWVVANYALGSLGGDPSETTGIIELGGASAQVSFVSKEPMPPEFLRTVNFGNITYNIYSHSFLHFGQNVAFEALRESLVTGGHGLEPCTPKGYSHVTVPLKLSPGSLSEPSRLLSALHSSGNFSECRSAALHLLQKGKEKCLHRNCYIGSAFMPKLQGKFLATENFFHTSKFFRLRSRAFLSDLMVAGKQFCGEDWSRLRKKHQAHDDEELMRYCFSSAYIIALLHDSLGIALDDERIGFANQVADIPLDWALGAFILQTTADLDTEHPDWIATIISDDSPTLLSLIAIAILLMVLAWSVSKWRKPQLKTIYDLEKGRYIVTRMGRS